jgi:hypothetical protein
MITYIYVGYIKLLLYKIQQSFQLVTVDRTASAVGPKKSYRYKYRRENRKPILVLYSINLDVGSLFVPCVCRS